MMSIILSLIFISLLFHPVIGGLKQAAEFALTGPTVKPLNNPLSVAVDPLTRSLFISENFNHRLLRFPSIDTITASTQPNLVFGQADFSGNFSNANAGSVVARGLANPSGIWVDDLGTLWVTDTGNHRVLWWTNAGSRVINGQDADGVVGQPSLIGARSPSTTAYGLRQPLALCVVANILWIADRDNFRVLRFDGASTLPAANASANGVIGQPSFTSLTGIPPPTSFTMYRPSSILYVPNVGLLVGQTGFKRMVFYPPSEAFRTTNGSGAFCYGHDTLFDVNPVLPLFNLDGIQGITVASDGTLFLSSYFTHRVLVYPPIPPSSNQIAPVAVFGQPDLISATIGSGLGDLSGCAGIYYDEQTNTLWVADASNNRVVKYSTAIPRVVNNPAINVDLTFEGRSPNFQINPPGSKATKIKAALGGLSEILPNGTAVNAAPFLTDGYSITTSTDNNNNLQYSFSTNEPAAVAVEYTVFKAPTPVSSAGVNFTGNPGSIKLSVSLGDWEFNSSAGQLELSLLLDVTPPVTSMATNDTAGHTTYTLFSSNILITTLRLLKFCVVDNTTITPVNATLAFAATNTTTTTYALTIRFPFFSSNVFYDPDFSVTLGDDEGGDGSEDDTDLLPLLSLIALVVVPVVLLAVVAAVMVFIWVKRYRDRMIDSSHSMSEQINF